MAGYRLPRHFKQTFIVYLPSSRLGIGDREKRELEKAAALRDRHRHTLSIKRTMVDADVSLLSEYW